MAKSQVTSPSLEPVHMTELVLPSHTNALGTIFGGVVMSWIDIAAAIAAQRYARGPCVTVSIDYLHFIIPIKLGNTVRVKATVSYVGRTSMEIAVNVDAENAFTGEVNPATQAFLTFVAVDKNGKAREIPPLKPRTAEEKKKFQEAEKRRKRRMEFFRPA
jgi:acyl-CoA hydrolase